MEKIGHTLAKEQVAQANLDEEEKEKGKEDIQ